MKKITFVLGLMVCLFTKAQITYHKYLDCSSEWRYYIDGSSIGGQSYRGYITRYFDGDTSINGIGYYRYKEIYNQRFTNQTYNSILGYLREDSNGNFIRSYTYNGNIAYDTIYKFDSIKNTNIGDTLPCSNLNDINLSYYCFCPVKSKNSFVFGSKILNATYAVDTLNYSPFLLVYPCIVEGIGATYPDFCTFGCCDRPILHLFHYTKNYDSISFANTSVNYSYDSFPMAIRSFTCSILPLKLLSFTTKLQTPNIVLLNWQTANEQNVAHINIQRSVNGKEFNAIGKVNAGKNEYQFSDNRFLLTVNGFLYYRLEIVDKDGSKTYSSVNSVQLKVNNENRVKIYPNPAKDIVTIESKDVREILITDNLGRTIHKSTVSGQQSTVNCKQFAKGVYIVKIILNTGEIVNEKVVVQ